MTRRPANAELERRVAQRTSELHRSEALYRGIIEQAEDIVLRSIPRLGALLNV